MGHDRPLGSKDYPVWRKAVHFRATVYFKDRPVSLFWTVHFEPYSKNEFILPNDQDGQFTLQKVKIKAVLHACQGGSSQALRSFFRVFENTLDHF